MTAVTSASGASRVSQVTVPIVLDASVRVLEGGRLLIGGNQLRAIRLSPEGARALAALQLEPPATAAAERLAARLIVGGLAHPRTQPRPALDVTLIVPTRDRVPELERCLETVAGQGPVVVVDDGSNDPGAVAAVCARAGAELIRRETPGGPAAARNTGLTYATTDLIAFLDDDCVPQLGWLELLAGAMSDPAVGAAAARIRPLADATPRAAAAARGGGPLSKFAAVRCPIDLGDRPGEVGPGHRITYLPTAALMVRRSALQAGFDNELRYGEDVDLVWRLHDAGWRVRYEPAAVVRHAEPVRWRSLTARRFRYGTAAGPLARRHPDRLAPVVVHPRTAAVVAVAAAASPQVTVVATALHIGLSAARLRRAGIPPRLGAEIAAKGLVDGVAAIGQAGTMLTPGVVIAGLIWPRTRPVTFALAVAQPLREWVRRSPGLDPVRYTALSLADDVAYGTGVWAGSIRARTLRPLIPAFRRSDRQARVPAPA